MHKKVLLAASTLMFAAGAFFLLSRGDRPKGRETVSGAKKVIRSFVTPATSQKTQTISESGLTFSPGDRTVIKVYDDVTGRLRYRFEAESWEPKGRDTDFHVEQLGIQIFMPRGEITYISADQADITIAQRSRSRIEARNGILQGNVKVVIDRTTSDWREAHPDLAERDAHPEALIHIDMDTAKFDMDRAELLSEGSIVVNSHEARIEKIRGLTVQWHQTDNRIELLRFEHGGRMVLRQDVNIVDLSLPGAERDKDADTEDREVSDATALASINSHMSVPRAQANRPMTIDTITAAEAVAEIRQGSGRAAANRPKTLPGRTARTQLADGRRGDDLRSPDALASEMEDMRNEVRSGGRKGGDESAAASFGARKQEKVHTYRAVFANQVIAEQQKSGQVIGKLEADRLEIHFDFGSRERRMMGPPSADRRASGDRPGADDETKPRLGEPALGTENRDQSTLVLTWDGPLELQPISSGFRSQTGRRFDVIATGNPVRIDSRQGRALCRQLVYRSARRQVWMSGGDDEPVQLSLGENRKLIAEEVYFDQQRGLAQVAGPGHMIDARRQGSSLVSSGEGLLTTGSEGAPKHNGKLRDPVEIRWTRGVDVELGRLPIKRINPKTGLIEEKVKDFLRRAWFHGDVRFLQGDERLSSDQVAVTFGPPKSDNAAADYIEHLNMFGNVRLERGEDLIEAERLDVELALTPDGRNVPRIVDAAGRVVARQAERVIHADAMHVVLGRYPGDVKLADDGKTRIVGRPKLGIETLDATGDVLIRDPVHNLKISRSQTLKARLRNGNELVRVTIVSPSKEIFARARYGDMAIHGHRIEIDVDRQSVDVPGPGKAWMVTRQDFGGRRLSGPTTVKTTWKGELQLRMARNYGIFADDVRSESEGFLLDCDKLTIRFAKMPPIRKRERPDFFERFAGLGEVVGDRIELKPSEPVKVRTERKRPTYVVAEGNASAISSTYAAGSPDGEKGRLLSRAHIAGNQIAVDLAREQMMVPCAGTLLIEDYQFGPKRSRTPGLGSARIGGPLMSSTRSQGPSQTLVTWENSMDFFVDRGLVTFDRNVSMVHRSGQKMVLKAALAEAFSLDTESLQHLGAGRKATLSCGRLILEFLSSKSERTPKKEKDQAKRATDLERLIARGAVHLQEGGKSLMGRSLQYLRSTDVVRLEGSEALEARIIDQDEKSQRLSMWRGPLLIWNRANNTVETLQSAIRTSSR